jgi:hypothetical protein
MSSWRKASLLSGCETAAGVASCTFEELVPPTLTLVRPVAEPAPAPLAGAAAGHAEPVTAPEPVIAAAEHERLLSEALAEAHSLGYEAGR